MEALTGWAAKDEWDFGEFQTLALFILASSAQQMLRMVMFDCYHHWYFFSSCASSDSHRIIHVPFLRVSWNVEPSIYQSKLSTSW